MKKVLLILATLLLGVVSFAQNVSRFETTDFAIKYAWEDWEDVPWEPCRATGYVDTNQEKIVINTATRQVFWIQAIISQGDDYVKFSCIDNSYKRCQVRFRATNGNKGQVYIYYNDVEYVYNIVVNGY